MTTAKISLLEYSTKHILPLLDGFATTLQTTGGFSLPAGIDETRLEYLKVENIYKRLGKMATNNLVAVSECVKNTDDSGVVTPKNLDEAAILGCEKDTGFIIKMTDAADVSSSFKVGEETTNSATRVLTIDISESSGIKIASIHLPGDGPNKQKSISDFLNDNLKHIRGAGVQVVCGDTNITDNKVMPEEKDIRMLEIAKYFYVFFGSPCLILSSNVPVIKHRRGFILRNQQLKKSVPESETSSESDGTIIAIKLGSGITREAIEAEIADIDMNCVAKLGGDSDPTILKSQSISPPVEALNFTTNIDGCIDDAGDGHPMEPIWLDHSLLYIKMQTLVKLLGITIPDTFLLPRNLIVANMGSIVNAGGKNWNTTYIPKQAEINKTDKAIYEIIKEENPASGLPNYEDIHGSGMGGQTDEIIINVLPTVKITEELTKLKDILVPKGGGGSGRRFNARRKHTHKCNCKCNCKSKSKSKCKSKSKSRKSSKSRRGIRKIYRNKRASLTKKQLY